MVNMEGNKMKRSSCGRGVLKLKTWSPLPRPGKDRDGNHNNELEVSSIGNRQERDGARQAERKTAPINTTNSNENTVKNTNKKLKKVLVKYSYKANQNRPGGFDELTIKQGEHIYYHEVNPNNPYWVKAENEKGEIGHVPANYIMEIETKPSQLPWLENRRIQREAEREKEAEDNDKGFGRPSAETLPPKKYVSAYNSQESAASSEFGCELCGKVFNGPKPYRMHMASKSHKEEAALKSR